MDYLSDDIVSEISEYVGDNFFFSGTVNHQFYRCCPRRKTNVCDVLESHSKTVESLKHGCKEKISCSRPFHILSVSTKVDSSECMKVAECLLSNDIEWDCNCISFAMSSKNFKFIDWIIKKDLEWSPLEALSECAIRQDLVGMKYLYKLGYKPDKAVAGLSAEYGNIEMISWLVETGCPVSNVVEIFASNGDFHKVIWANSKGMPCTKRSLDAAALSGNHWMVNYMIDLDIVPDIRTLECACIGNSNETIQVLYERFPRIFDVIDMTAIADLFARYGEEI